MFQSSSYHKIDTKGRIIIPSRFKSILQADKVYGVVVTNMEDCLYAYTTSGWDIVAQKIMSAKSSVMSAFRRFFMGNSCECTCDKQDRILIPISLRAYAKLDKEIVLVGNQDHFEIWDRGRWDAANEKMEQELKKEEVREAIASLGL